MIKKSITFAEMKSCIDTAVMLCFEDGIYQPYMKNFAIWDSILMHCTDKINDETSVDEIYQLVCDEGLKQVLMGYHYIQEIHGAILETIDIAIQKEVRSTKLTKAIDSLIDKMSEELKNPETVEMLKQAVSEMTAEING